MAATGRPADHPGNEPDPAFGWPPADWYHGYADHADGRRIYDYTPLPAAFGAADALAWVDHTIRYLEFLTAERVVPVPDRTPGRRGGSPRVRVFHVAITPDGRPERTPVHNARLVADDLCRRARLPPPPPVDPDPECRLRNDLDTLRRMRDWLRRVVHRGERSSAEAVTQPATTAAFWVEDSPDHEFHVCRETADGAEKVSIPWEAFVYLRCLLAVPAGVYVTSDAVKGQMGANDFRPRDVWPHLPGWAKRHIETARGKGSCLRPGPGPAEPKPGRS